MKKSDRKVLDVVDDMYLLESPDYVFIKGGVNRRAKIVLRRCLVPTDKVIFCDRCHTLPAIQLDRGYMRGEHDFTLCRFCLEEIKNM